jgi:hypothetical protein
MAAFCGKVIADTWTDFSDNNIVTAYQVFNEEEFDFPEITVCNLAPYVTEEAKIYLTNNLKNSGVNPGIIDDNLTLFNPSDYRANTILISRNIVTIGSFVLQNVSDEVKKTFGFNKNELIISCVFLNSNCIDDFEWIYNERYGNCFKFNSLHYSNGTKKKQVKKILSFGEFNGFDLQLLVKSENNIVLPDTFNYINGNKTFYFIFFFINFIF